MQFRLIYQGPLSSASRSNARVDQKHAIRRALHPQLRELWTHPPISGHADEWLQDATEKHGLSVIRRVGEHRFAPLVCKPLKLVAELDILLLRPAQPGGLIRHGGDIDNQLKTLFDALRCPHSEAELPAGDAPGPGESPFFCLLDDDERIVDLRVSTDRFLDGPDERSVHLTLTVRTRPTRVIYANMPLA